MSYPFISLDAKVEDLANHLRTHFGVEKSGKKAELVEEILKQEELAGYIRPKSGNESKPEGSAENIKNTDLPLLQQKRVKIKIAPSETESGDVYVSIGDWDALIKRNEEVAIPESAYLLLNSAGEMRYTQNKDGTLKEYFAPRYSIIHLGYAE